MARHSYHVTPFVNGVLNGPTDGLISYENRSVSGEIISLSKGVFSLTDVYKYIYVLYYMHDILCVWSLIGSSSRRVQSVQHYESGGETIFLINFYFQLRNIVDTVQY